MVLIFFSSEVDEHFEKHHARHPGIDFKKEGVTLSQHQ